MFFLKIFCFFFFLFNLKLNIILTSNSTCQFSNQVILILADGVRYDYVQDKSLLGFQNIISQGVRAEYVLPIFPSNSYPNWYSIVTGLYSENHGFVENFMYDPDKKEFFLMAPHLNASNEHWWNESEPIWVTAEKSNVKTAMYWWDGCQVKIKNTLPTKCEKYKRYLSWSDPKKEYMNALDEILTNFKNNIWKFALVYYEAIDLTGHIYGTKSKERIQVIKELDEILLYLQNEISLRNLTQCVNVVLVSDHGMLDVKKEKNSLIDLEDYIETKNVDFMLEIGSISILYPKDGKKQKILNNLANANITGFNFYDKDQIPTYYHYQNNKRIGPILLVADKGYFIRGFQNVKTIPTWDMLYKGHHGYDPVKVQEMHTIFYGFGPKFNKNFTNQPILMVDHYNLLCNLLDINPLPNNGSWSRIKNMIKNSFQRNILETNTNELDDLMLAKANEIKIKNNTKKKFSRKVSLKNSSFIYINYTLLIFLNFLILYLNKLSF